MGRREGRGEEQGPTLKRYLKLSIFGIGVRMQNMTGETKTAGVVEVSKCCEENAL